MTHPLNTPTSDDKLYAGLSYAGLCCCFIGTLIVFFLKKDESSHIKFHGLQALAFGLFSVVLSIILITLSSIPLLSIIVGLIGIILQLALLGIWIALMVMAFMGKDFRIPLLADWIDEHLMK